MNRVKRGLLLSACILLAGFLYIASQPIPSADAYEKSTQLQVNFSEMMRLNIEDNFRMRLNADGKSHFQASALKIYLETNSYYGYDFIMETESPDLINTSDPSLKIPNMRTQNNLVNPDDTVPMNTWGIGVVKESGNFQDVFYSNGSNIPLKQYTYMGGNTDVTAHDKLALVIGARIDDTIPNGSYSTTIRFTIIPKIVVNTITTARFLQEMNGTVLNTMSAGQVYQLRDLRDNKPYYISRIGNNVTMLQNLDYDLSEGDTLGQMTSQISSNYKVISNVADHTSIDYNQAVYVSGNNIYRDGAGNETVNNEAPDNASDANNKAGGYYSYAAAIANSTNLYDTEGMRNYSLCPKNWRLPTYNEAQGFNDASNMPVKWSDNNGYIAMDNTLKLGEGQWYWTAEIDKPNKTVKVYSPNNLTANYVDARNLASVRCMYNVSFPYKLTLVYDENNTEVKNFSTTSTTDTVVVNVRRNIQREDGKHLIGFAETPDASIPTVYLSTTLDPAYLSCSNGVANADYCYDYIRLTLTQGEKTLYGVWARKCNRAAKTIEEAVCLQDMNSLVRKSMTFNEQYRLMDQRDGQKYWISRLEDDRVWMTQNLNYSADYKIHNYDESNVSQATTKNITYSAEEGYYMKNGITKKSLANQPEDIEQKHYNLGKYYGSEDGVICPARWEIGDITDAMKAAGIISDNSITSNNSEIAGGNISYNSNLTNENIFGFPLYLVAGGYRENEKSYNQGREAKYLNGKGNGTVFNLVTEDGLNVVEPKAKKYSSEYGQVRCVASAKGLDEIEYMQDLSLNVIASSPSDVIEKQLIDKRDNKKYWVKKDNKGYVYMTQNLDFRIPVTGIELTGDLSDGARYIESARTIRNSEDDQGIIYQYYGGDYYFNPDDSTTTRYSTEDLAEDDPKWKGHEGSYYTASAVSLGRYSTGYMSGSSYVWTGTQILENGTICPRNWTVEARNESRPYYYISNNSYYSSTSSYSYRIANPSIAKGYAKVTGVDTITKYASTSSQHWTQSNATLFTSSSGYILRPVRCVMNLPFVQRMSE